MLTRKNAVVVVDAYSGGRHLIGAYQALGFPVVHVQSGWPSYFEADNDAARRQADRHVVAAEHTDDALVALLREERARVVVAGAESAVLLADHLNDALDLPFRNAASTSNRRRDKFEMQQTVAAAGLASIVQRRVETVTELDTWLHEHGRRPVVVKPLRSAGSDGVHVCHSRDEAVAALAEILDRPDMFGAANGAALCQEFLVGDEYVLNGVVCNGVFAVTEGWRSDKLDHQGARVYDTQYLFCPDDPHHEEIAGYVERVCAALGIENGPFHAEVMLTTRGPVLIEVGARIAGGADPYFIETCLGRSQISAVVSSSLHPAGCAEALRTAPRPRPVRRAAYVYLIARVAGTVERLALDGFFDVEGVGTVAYRYAVGDHQQLTRDLLTAAGVVTVTAPDHDRLAAAIRDVREVEAAMYAATVAGGVIA
ncbi:ATP-grasp domain-containing protein [Pseudonocardia xinjiangensis]|uniref:ATP-grasp domain-containing protein n=1 Tax=Pseudonocardia xinjiangensis TaxID=75289 RepID=UPI003D93E8BC